MSVLSGMFDSPSTLVGLDDDDVERCIACLIPFKEGDKVHDDTSGGQIHADCCGPERESYVGDSGEPPREGEPIPEPYIWTADPRG